MKLTKFLIFTLFGLSIAACTKEPDFQPNVQKPLGYEFAGLWKTDSVSINGIKATNNVNSLLWLEIDSTVSSTGGTRGYSFTGAYQENELTQYNYMISQDVSGLAAFEEIPPVHPWEPGLLNLRIYKEEPGPCDEYGCSTSIVTLKFLPIKTSTVNMLTVEMEMDSIKRFYRFIRQ